MKKTLENVIKENSIVWNLQHFFKKCKRYVWKKYKAAFVLVSWTIASKIFFYLSTSCAQLIRLGEKRANSYMKNPWISNDQGVGESMIKYLSQVNAYISVYKLWWLIFFNIDILPTVSKSNKKSDNWNLALWYFTRDQLAKIIL